MRFLIFSIFVLAIFNTPVFADEQVSSATIESDSDGYKGKHHRKGKGKRGKFAEAMLEKVDTNKDGQVDLAEFLANAEQRFTKMDLNSDGYVTLEEGREAQKLRRAKHKEMRKKRREERRQQREEQQAEDVDVQSES